jgi:hypothetical protein
MYHPGLMKEVQGSGDHKQELLQKGFLKSPILEQIPQICQVQAQGRKDQALMASVWSFDMELIKRHTQMIFTRVVSIDGLYVT